MIHYRKVEWESFQVEAGEGSQGAIIHWDCPYCGNTVEGTSCDCGAGLRLAAKKEYGSGTNYTVGRTKF